jgi:hypothetical protein
MVGDLFALGGSWEIEKEKLAKRSSKKQHEEAADGQTGRASSSSLSEVERVQSGGLEVWRGAH